MSISASRVTRLGLSGYGVAPYGDFSGKNATEVARGVGRGGKRYTHTFENGLRINGTREEIEAAVQRFKRTTEEVQRVISPKEDRKTEKSKATPSEILASMPDRAPLTIVEPPAPVEMPDIQLYSDDEAVLALLLA